MIRAAEDGDIEEMHRIRLAVRENRLSNPDLVTRDDYRRFIDVDGKGWVAELDGRIVGFAVADRVRTNIWALFVDPDYERRGFGRALHDTMLGWLFASGIEMVWLSTDPGTRAEKFYRMAGWKPAGEQNGEVRYDLERSDWFDASPILG